MSVDENKEEQVVELLEAYEGLSVVESGTDRIRILGEMHVFRTGLGFTLDRTYGVEILVPLKSDELPKIMDVSGAVSDNYPHRYGTGELCLEVDAVIWFRLIDGLRLVGWMEEFVEPFFFSYEYYDRFGFFPFGERPHGLGGVMDAYKGIFRELQSESVWRLMVYCGKKQYRGCDACPCGSDRRVKECHGEVLFPLMTDCRKKEIIKKDIKYIKRELMKYGATEGN